MKAYREIDSSKRTPPERTEVHVINNGLLTSGFIQDGQWYLGEHETAVLKFDGVWLEEYASQSPEPNTQRSEEIRTTSHKPEIIDKLYPTEPNTVTEPYHKEAIELVKKYIPNDALAKDYILELLNQKK